MEAAVLIVVVLVVCIVWVYQFVQLMMLSEADFPGRYDKCLWTAAFIVAAGLAPFAFYGWKSAYKAMLAAEAGAKDQVP